MLCHLLSCCWTIQTSHTFLFLCNFNISFFSFVNKFIKFYSEHWSCTPLLTFDSNSEAGVWDVCRRHTDQSAQWAPHHKKPRSSVLKTSDETSDSTSAPQQTPLLSKIDYDNVSQCSSSLCRFTARFMLSLCVCSSICLSFHKKPVSYQNVFENDLFCVSWDVKPQLIQSSRVVDWIVVVKMREMLWFVADLRSNNECYCHKTTGQESVRQQNEAARRSLWHHQVCFSMYVVDRCWC